LTRIGPFGTPFEEVKCSSHRVPGVGCTIIGWTLVLSAAMATSVLLFVRRVWPDPPFAWDEAYHALYGLLIADGLRQAQWLSVAYDSFLEVYWPPLHSWYLAALFLLFGASRVVARAGSLVALVGAAAVAYATGCRLAAPTGRDRPTDATRTLAGLIAAGGVLATGGVLIMASQAMLELPALFCLLVGCALYMRTGEGQAGHKTWITLGISVFATYLTKSNYGVVLALALVCAFAVDGGWLGIIVPGFEPAERAPDVLRTTRRGQLLALATLCGLLVSWFAYPPKVIGTLRLLINEPRGPSPGSVAGLLFYPIHLLWLAGSWPMLTCWLVVFAVTCRRAPLCDPRLRFLAILLAIQFVLAEVSRTKLDRHILPMAPAFALLAATWASRTWVTLGSCVGRISMAAALVAVLAWHVYAVAPQFALAGSGDPVRELTRSAAFAPLYDGQPVLVLGSNDGVAAPAALDWWLILDASMPLSGAGSLFQKASPVPVLGRRWRRDRWPGSGVCTMYVGLPLGAPANAVLGPGTYREQVAGLLARHPVDAVVVLRQMDRGPFPELTSTFVADTLAELGFVPNEGSGVTPRDALTFRHARP